MRVLVSMLLVCSCLIFAGCPLQTESPIRSDAAVSVPGWLPGKWTKLNAGKEGATKYEIKADPTKPSALIVIGLDSNSNPDHSSNHPSLLAKVGDQLFISVYNAGDEMDDAGYYHYAISRTKQGEMQLVPLKEHIVSSSASGDELAAYIKSHTDPADYLEHKDTELYRRK